MKRFTLYTINEYILYTREYNYYNIKTVILEGGVFLDLKQWMFEL